MCRVARPAGGGRESICCLSTEGVGVELQRVAGWHRVAGSRSRNASRRQAGWRRPPAKLGFMRRVERVCCRIVPLFFYFCANGAVLREQPALHIIGPMQLPQKQCDAIGSEFRQTCNQVDRASTTIFLANNNSSSPQFLHNSSPTTISSSPTPCMCLPTIGPIEYDMIEALYGGHGVC